MLLEARALSLTAYKEQRGQQNGAADGGKGKAQGGCGPRRSPSSSEAPGLPKLGFSDDAPFLLPDLTSQVSPNRRLQGP